MVSESRQDKLIGVPQKLIESPLYPVYVQLRFHLIFTPYLHIHEQTDRQRERKKNRKKEERKNGKKEKRKKEK